MNNKDTITKTYMKNNAVFADAFNFYVYSGEQVIKPDALQYSGQVRKTADYNKIRGNHLSRSEYPSGFRKEDRLTPVITLVLYFGVDKWDGAKSLHEMLNDKDPRLLRYVQDYRINLIEPNSISEDELNSFATSLREVLGYIKYSNDKDKLISFATANPDTIIDADAARVINIMTKTHIDIPDDAKEVNMCKAIEDLIKDSKAEGRLEGINEGIAEGIVRGRNEGIAEGIVKGRIEGINIGKIDLMSGLVKDNFISLKDAAARLNMTEEGFAALMKK